MKVQHPTKFFWKHHNFINLLMKFLSIYLFFINFYQFIDEIVIYTIPQTILYNQQPGKVFTTTAAELKAFLGMHVVMGYLVLPCLRDYWSSKLDLGVDFVAKVMPLRRFEEISAVFHFNDNMTMKPRESPDHDKAFKVRPNSSDGRVV